MIWRPTECPPTSCVAFDSVLARSGRATQFVAESTRRRVLIGLLGKVRNAQEVRLRQYFADRDGFVVIAAQGQHAMHPLRTPRPRGSRARDKPRACPANRAWPTTSSAKSGSVELTCCSAGSAELWARIVMEAQNRARPTWALWQLSLFVPLAASSCAGASKPAVPSKPVPAVTSASAPLVSGPSPAGGAANSPAVAHTPELAASEPRELIGEQGRPSSFESVRTFGGDWDGDMYDRLFPKRITLADCAEGRLLAGRPASSTPCTRAGPAEPLRLSQVVRDAEGWDGQG